MKPAAGRVCEIVIFKTNTALLSRDLVADCCTQPACARPGALNGILKGAKIPPPFVGCPAVIQRSPWVPTEEGREDSNRAALSSVPSQQISATAALAGLPRLRACPQQRRTPQPRVRRARSGRPPATALARPGRDGFAQGLALRLPPGLSFGVGQGHVANAAPLYNGVDSGRSLRSGPPPRALISLRNLDRLAPKTGAISNLSEAGKTR